jgi:tRNA modification GTPase
MYDNEIIDEGVALFFPEPNSFTGEDVLELHAHGGPVVIDLLLQFLVSQGVRLARPGEFSERAFLNNKIDLTQAEAIADLINASSRQAARLALRSLQGAFSRTIEQLLKKIIHLRGYIEAAIDFTDEDIDFLSNEKLVFELQDAISNVTTIQHQAKQGSLLREGITVVIMGEPNVGKSSLLNALSGKEMAIVTDIPGTTRDVLRDYILIDGMPVHIIDTAGLRESVDIVEVEGIKRAYQEMEKADIILYMTSDDTDSIPAFLSSKAQESERSIVQIRNKIDLHQEQPSVQTMNDGVVISLSAKTGAGLNLLRTYIKSQVGLTGEEEGLFLARQRHLEALRIVKSCLTSAWQQLRSRAGELAAEDLRLAQEALNRITGEFSADDLLGHIFANFCIGK